MSEPTKARIPATFTAPLPAYPTEPPPVAAALRALALLPAEGGPTVQACRSAAAELLTDYFRAEAEAARCGLAGAAAGVLGGHRGGAGPDGSVPPAPMPVRTGQEPAGRYAAPHVVGGQS